MLKKIRLKNFKNFQDAELILGPFTLLIGTNASGKSNIRDALRFLHGIARGYNLAEIMGEKYVEGGVLQWRGIRGGTREITFLNSETFTLEVEFTFDYQEEPQEAIYSITVNPSSSTQGPQIFEEQLYLKNFSNPVFKCTLIKESSEEYLQTQTEDGSCYKLTLSPSKPAVSQFTEINVSRLISYIFTEHLAEDHWTYILSISEQCVNALNDIHFLDLNPEALRLPSVVGQTILGDRGENLSSVLFDICQDPQKKAILLEWIQELTPMDAQDFEFPSDFTGKILLTLVEESGQKISAYSASDGTLRFLAMIAALLGSSPAKLYFFEELDNGIHPTRLHLLLQLIERQVSQGKIQMIATTHSSQLLRLLSPNLLESVSLTYRLENRPDAKIIRILDIPNAQEVLEKQTLAHLHESAWLENVMEFMSDEGEE
ncbi:AAA family ATPase [Laspinema sp. D1]|uniref:AAA family ATPase n=1 Tax=Laspinema palackyanum D2a TaxID=2953684 RepID=A0ABT2MML6_9CYAN|nr:AAA family ATPase [Laspinema sp. D2a]